VRLPRSGEVFAHKQDAGDRIKMMRVNIKANANCLTLRIEGELTKAWVEEVRLCWVAATALKLRRIRVDLTDVSYIDAEGRRLLASMHGQGVEIIAAGVYNNAIVEEIVN
jgi:anti-anti-sigma regulatory factor